MSWYVNPTINDGYPSNTGFPQSYPADWSGNFPVGAWRVTPSVNEGYPYTWWQIAIDTGKYYDPNIPIGGDFPPDAPEDDIMDIGGRQTNYPNGFSTISGSIINFDRHGQKFEPNPFAGKELALINNMYACKTTSLKGLINAIKDKVSGDDKMSETARIIIGETLGGNIYDSIAIAKLFPFNIPDNDNEETSIDLCAGLFRVSVSGFHMVKNTCVLLDFGLIIPGITQGWEIETIDWSIYLPYCGTFPIDLRSNEPISLKCLVDLVSGVCEYYLILRHAKDEEHQDENGEIIFSTTGKMGADIPINMNAAKVAGNLQGWKNSIIGQGLQLGGTAAAMLFPGAGTVVGGAMQALGNEMQQHLPAHQTLTSPSFGGGLCFGAPTKARIIGRRPIIQHNAMGFPQLRGLTHEWKVDKVEEAGAGNYAEFRNYKCDIISATTEEKAEIEKLMNNGVFI